MKLTRLRTLGTLAAAGTLTGATLVLSAAQASAMPIDQWAQSCTGDGGRLGFGTYYEFDVNGNPAGRTVVVTCRIGSHVYWNDTDINGEPY